MSAKELFKVLGFEIVRNDKHFLKYERNWEGFKYVIVFDKYAESYTSYCKMYSRFFIDKELNKVIQYQLKELGWLR